MSDISPGNHERRVARIQVPDKFIELTARLVKQDVRIREELGEDIREEGERWVGTVWPVAATVLIPH